MRRADQPSLVGMMLDQLQIDIETIGFEKGARTSDRQFADPARAKAAAENDGFRTGPRLVLEEATKDREESLRIVLDGTEHDPRGLDRSAGKQLVELFLADLRRLGIAERILSRHRFVMLAPAVEGLAEGIPARLVAKEAVGIFELQVVAVDRDARERGGSVRRKRRTIGSFGHQGARKIGGLRGRSRPGTA